MKNRYTITYYEKEFTYNLKGGILTKETQSCIKERKLIDSENIIDVIDYLERNQTPLKRRHVVKEIKDHFDKNKGFLHCYVEINLIGEVPVLEKQVIQNLINNIRKSKKKYIDMFNLCVEKYNIDNFKIINILEKEKPKTMKIVKLDFSDEDNQFVYFDNGLMMYSKDSGSYDENYIDFMELKLDDEFNANTIEEFVKLLEVRTYGFIIKTSDGIPKWLEGRTYDVYYNGNVTLCVTHKDDYNSSEDYKPLMQIDSESTCIW